ncbi:MAG: hypothetical protein AABX98_07150 [Nanoarchaeota archaeon]
MTNRILKYAGIAAMVVGLGGGYHCFEQKKLYEREASNSTISYPERMKAEEMSEYYFKEGIILMGFGALPSIMYVTGSIAASRRRQEE